MQIGDIMCDLITCNQNFNKPFLWFVSYIIEDLNQYMSQIFRSGKEARQNLQCNESQQTWGNGEMVLLGCLNIE